MSSSELRTNAESLAEPADAVTLGSGVPNSKSVDRENARIPLNVYALVTDAYGGHGGVSVFNRDLFEAFLTQSPYAWVTAAPRVISHELGPLPERLDFRVRAAGGIFAFLATVLRDLPVVARSDVIYCGHLNLSPLAWLLGRMTHRPVLGALYGIEAWQPPRRGLRAWVAKRLDRYYAISDYTRQRFMSWSNVPAARIDLLPNAIHLQDYGVGPRSDELRDRLGIGGDPVLLTVGRLVSRDRAKGFDEVVDVLPRLIDRHPRLVYVIAGEGDDRARLEARVLAAGLSDHVAFTGFVDQADKAALYRLADLYVMPSRGEGFGFVFLEALACGVPVIASSKDGSRDAVRGGLLGQMVDPDDPDQLVAAVEAALAEPNRGIPDGLCYFAFDRFVARANDLLARTARQ